MASKTLSELLGGSGSNNILDSLLSGGTVNRRVGISRPQTEEEKLASDLRGLETRSLQAQALGLADTLGTGAKGFLTGALGYLTRPQSATLGLLTGLSGNVQAGEPTDPLQRFLAGLGGTRFSGGDIIGQAAPDASIVEKTSRALAGLGIDVATDPLTYLGFGRGGALRAADLAAATEAQIAKVAPARLSIPKTPKEIAPTTNLGTSTAAARDLADNRIQLLTNQPVVEAGKGFGTSSLAKGQVTPQEVIARTPRETVPPVSNTRVSTTTPLPTAPPIYSTVTPVDPFVAELSQVAAAGQALKGPYGMRQNIEKKLLERYSPEEAANITKNIIGDTTTDVRGGITVRVPGVGRDAAGNITTGENIIDRTVASITPGAGYAVDKMGLRGVADNARNIYNEKYRSKGFYQYLQKHLNGAYGVNYARLIEYEVTGGKSGLSYDTYSKLQKIEKNRSKTGINNDNLHSRLLRSSALTVLDAANPDDAKAAKDIFYHNMSKNDFKLNPNATDDEIAGYNSAKQLLDQQDLAYNDYIEIANELGIKIPRNVADNFVPRILTQQEKEYRKTHNLSLDDISPVNQRSGGFATVGGKLINETAPELNKQAIDLGQRPAGHKIFETDPDKIASEYLANVITLQNHLSLVKSIKEAEILTFAKKGVEKTVNVYNLQKKVEKTNTFIGDKLTAAYNKFSEIDPNSPGYAKIKAEFDTKMQEIAKNHDVIISTMDNIIQRNPDDVRAVGAIVGLLKDSLEKSTNIGADISLKEIQKIINKRGLITKKPTLKNAGETVDLGLQPLGIDSNIRIPKELSNAYADVAVKDAVQKYFEIDKGLFNTKVKPFFDGVFSPYYSLFKMTATIGRPGGYHVRNITGGWWNNYLGDVSVADHKLSAGLMAEVKKSQDEAIKAVDNIKNGKPSGLSDDEHTLAKGIVQIAKDRGNTSVDYETSQLANYILLNKLTKVKVGDHTMADVFTAASDNGIFKYNKRMETLRNDAQMTGNELADSLLDPKYVNLFRGKSKAELNKIQMNVNKLANLKYLEISGDYADKSENFVRMAAFINGSRKYGLNDGGTAATMLTKALQFDYADLSVFERDVLKNVIPFYTWTRRNVPLQFHALLSQPGKFNKIGFAKDEAQNQFTATGDNEYMAQIVPGFMRDKLGFISNIMAPGTTNPLAIGFDLPAADLNKFLSFGSLPSVGSNVTQQTVQSLNPLLKTGFELLTGVDTFTGAKFSKKGSKFDWPIPGVTFKDAQGGTRIDAGLWKAVNNTLPPVGMISRLTGMGSNKERLFTNWLSTFACTPLTTLTPSQASAQINTQSRTLSDAVERAVNQRGIDKTWLKNLAATGAKKEDVDYLVSMGLGRPTVTE